MWLAAKYASVFPPEERNVPSPRPMHLNAGSGYSALKPWLNFLLISIF